MKTSRSQYDLLLSYMEHHGDLSKPAKTSGGRAINLQRWCELVDLLNSDSTGDKKSDVKWKKVWSDFKNNTKRKAARLHHAAISADGPVSNAKLSDLEQRALGIISTQAATCLSDVMEAGFAEPNTPSEQESRHSSFATVKTKHEDDVWDLPGRSTCSHTFPAPLIQPNQVVEVAIRPESPSQWTEQDAAPLDSAPSPAGETTCRRSRRKRRLRPVGRSDPYLWEEWRKFKIEQHRDWLEMEREQKRIRELELENQRRWQNLCLEALKLLKDFLNKK